MVVHHLGKLKRWCESWLLSPTPEVGVTHVTAAIKLWAGIGSLPTPFWEPVQPGTDKGLQPGANSPGRAHNPPQAVVISHRPLPPQALPTCDCPNPPSPPAPMRKWALISCCFCSLLSGYWKVATVNHEQWWDSWSPEERYSIWG